MRTLNICTIGCTEQVDRVIVSLAPRFVFSCELHAVICNRGFRVSRLARFCFVPTIRSHVATYFPKIFYQYPLLNEQFYNANGRKDEIFCVKQGNT